jgi:hypothetical protein
MKPKTRRRSAQPRDRPEQSAAWWIVGAIVAAPAMLTFVCLGVAVLAARAVFDSAEHAIRSLRPGEEAR